MSAVSFSLTPPPHPDVRQKSEDNLAVAESEVEKQTRIVTDLTKRNEELQVQADEAVRLKDKVDE